MYIFTCYETHSQAIFTNSENLHKFIKEYIEEYTKNGWSCARGIDWDVTFVGSVDPTFIDWLFS